MSTGNPQSPEGSKIRNIEDTPVADLLTYHQDEFARMKTFFGQRQNFLIRRLKNTTFTQAFRNGLGDTAREVENHQKLVEEDIEKCIENLEKITDRSLRVEKEKELRDMVSLSISTQKSKMDGFITVWHATVKKNDE